MAVSAGTAGTAGTTTLQVVPVLAKNFSRNLVGQMAGPAVKGASKTGTDAGRTFGQKFSSTTGKSVGKDGEKHGRLFGTRFTTGIRTGVGPVKSVFRGFGPALGVAFGATALVAGIKAVTNEARDAAAVGRQTSAVLKSTGGVANVSAKQVSDLAQALSVKVGVDDDAIQSGQNLLLTFTGIRNQVGKGNDVFNQASAAVLDLTASMNHGQITAQGMKSATIQVGKALNDPIKGITALTRVGVTFSEQQKKQIKTLVESGDKLGAQKIILAELRKEFGGSAAASADAGKRFGVFIGNLKEQIGGVLLPILNKLLGFLVDKLPGALATVGGWFRKAALGVKALGAAFSGEGVTSDGFVGVMEHIGVALRSVWNWVTRTAKVLGGILGPAFRSIAESIKPAVAAFVKAFLPGLKSWWHVVQTQVLPALKVLAIIIGVVLYAALKYVLPLLIRIAGPVMGFMYKQTAQLIQWLSNLIRWIGRVGAWLLRWITGTKTTGEAVKELGRRVGVFASNMAKQWQGITRQVGNALGFLKRTSVTVLSFMIRLWLRWAGSIIDAAAHALGWVPGLGGKLRAAQSKFHEFAASVNRSLDKIKNKHVSVTASAKVVIGPGTRAYLKVANVPGFHAQGGPIHGPGTGTSDSVPAMLSAGEHVWTAKEVAKAGGHGAVESMRRNVVRGYARGGRVLDVPTKFSSTGDILGQFYHPVVDGTRRIGQRLADRLGSLMGKGLSKILAEGVGGGKASILNFIRSVDSHPYVWGGVGPGGYDCSGLTGEVFNRIKGRRSYRRAFTTASNFGALGFRPGPGGVYTIGVNPGHHMAGRYGRLGFEAESTRTGIKVGAAASPPASFARQYHLAKGGRVRAARELAAAGIEVGGDPAGMWLRENKRIGIFDKGGMLMPGQLGVNNTSRPEPVLGPGQGLVDYGRMADAFLDALERRPPTVRVDDIHAGLVRKKGRLRGGIKLGLT